MAVTVGGTSITFNDGTVQSTAAGGLPASFDAIGSYAILINAANSNTAINATVAGSTLRYNHSGNFQGVLASTPLIGYRYRFQSSGTTFDGGGTALTGTWRKVSTGATFQTISICCVPANFWMLSLYVRIA